jgi:hypothetical protein
MLVLHTIKEITDYDQNQTRNGKRESIKLKIISCEPPSELGSDNYRSCQSKALGCSGGIFSIGLNSRKGEERIEGTYGDEHHLFSSRKAQNKSSLSWTLSLSLQGLSRSLVLWSPPQHSRAGPDLFPPATPRGKGKGMAPVIVLGLVFV